MPDKKDLLILCFLITVGYAIYTAMTKDNRPESEKAQATKICHNCNLAVPQPADFSNRTIVLDLEGSNLAKVKFYNSDLRNSNFKDTNLREANFQNSDLSNADLSNADIRNANFIGTHHPNIKLNGAIYNSRTSGLSQELLDESGAIKK